MLKAEQQSSKKRFKKSNIGIPMNRAIDNHYETLHSLFKGEQLKINNHYALLDWEALPENIKIVHSLKLSTHPDSQLLRENATTCLSRWDAISTSIIDLTDRVPEIYLKKTSERSHLQASAANENRYFTKSNKMTLGEIAFVLHADASNIIGAFQKDVWFNNHAGVRNLTPEQQSTLENKGALSRAIINGIPKPNAPINLPQQTYLHVHPYKEILNKRNIGEYSEVIITGREGVYIHPWRSPSRAIRVEEILILPNGEIEWVNDIPILKEGLNTAIATLKRLNPEVPLSILK